jgi:hypothetical protein
MLWSIPCLLSTCNLSFARNKFPTSPRGSWFDQGRTAQLWEAVSDIEEMPDDESVEEDDHRNKRGDESSIDQTVSWGSQVAGLVNKGCVFELQQEE